MRYVLHFMLKEKKNPHERKDSNRVIMESLSFFIHTLSVKSFDVKIGYLFFEIPSLLYNSTALV